MTEIDTMVPRAGLNLSIRGLDKSYGATTVLSGFDLDVRSGELVTLLGANGSGKSTALRCVVGLTEPSAGTITVGDQVVLPGRPVREVAMVFQRIHLVPRRTVLDNVCAGALARIPLSRSWSPWAIPSEIREEAMACLERVGLADRPHTRAGRLSGGQQQRVAVARALCQRARVLLADEPVSALDPAAAEQVMRLLRSLADEGMAVAAVLHQPDLARRHADRVVGLRQGRIAFTSSPRHLDDSLVAELYEPDLAASLL
ncbi:phosphonate ABC transporter ATP-binding protein [Nocardioides houyundeii]|uniref:phosphonate ABC transporter ATP-binding protein n=1 Tax=Nocardioides houyundeii TaxID=2045452 RepID=UPI001F07D51A|nr:ATP-binding cassette domain-containing protein [Nocardioides houyundeii]